MQFSVIGDIRHHTGKATGVRIGRVVRRVPMSGESGPTVKLRYVGARFTGARLPLDVLPDLPAFRDLLRSLAKERWRTENPGRKRLPKGFGDTLSFDLVDIEDGSAMPKLELIASPRPAMLPGMKADGEVLLDESYESLASLIDDVANARGLDGMSSDRAKILNKFGSGLLDGERIEFVGTSGSDGNVVYLDTARRKALITRTRDTYDKRIDGTGRLAGVHKSGRLRVDTEEFGEIDVTVEEDRVAEFDGNIGSNVQFSLRARLDRQDAFKSVDEVLALDLVDEPDTLDRKRTRIEDLRRLPTGWLDGGGEPVTEVSADAALAFLNLNAGLAEAFRIYPTPSGGILFEAKVGRWDLSVEFDASGSVELSGVEIDGADEIEPTSFSDHTEPTFVTMFKEHTGQIDR